MPNAYCLCHLKKGIALTVAVIDDNTNAGQARVAALRMINAYRARAGLRPVCRAELWGLTAEQRLDAIKKAKQEAERVEAERRERGLWG